MPELPEVETIAQTLRPALVNRVIVAVEVLDPMVIREPAPQDFVTSVTGRRVTGVRRRGKHLVLSLGTGLALMVHLGMTGRLLLSDPSLPPRHARVKFELQGGSALWYADMRKFGRLALSRNPEEQLRSLGPEPLAAETSAEALYSTFRGRRRPVKSLLLDQAVLAGLGNIYADEALFQAGINPCTPAGQLSLDDVQRLLVAVRTVLTQGIRNRGTTISDYVDGNGRAGDNQSQLCVYGRGGEACVRCGTTLVRLRLGGRSTCFCPVCQPDPTSQIG